VVFQGTIIGFSTIFLLLKTKQKTRTYNCEGNKMNTTVGGKKNFNVRPKPDFN
jgi:predicted O-methyltransferase YrrM